MLTGAIAAGIIVVVFLVLSDCLCWFVYNRAKASRTAQMQHDPPEGLQQWQYVGSTTAAPAGTPEFSNIPPPPPLYVTHPPPPNYLTQHVTNGGETTKRPC